MEEVFPIAKRLGYAGVEVWHFHLLKTGESHKCSELRIKAEKLGLSLSFHALSWDLNYTSKLDNIRENSLLMLENSIDTAAELNANPVVIHPGRKTIPGDSPQESWHLLIEGTKRLTDHAQTKGLDIALEVMEHTPNEFFITPEDANHILDQITSPNFGITFDAAHAPLDVDLVEYISRIERVIHIHLSDLTARKRHIALNTGERDFTDLVRFIKENLRVVVALEGLEYERTEWLAQHNITETNRMIKNYIR